MPVPSSTIVRAGATGSVATTIVAAPESSEFATISVRIVASVEPGYASRRSSSRWSRSTRVSPTAGLGSAVGAGRRGVLEGHPRSALDLDRVVRTRERRGRGLAGRARPADRLEEVLEPRRRGQPEHHELVVGLVDDLVLDVAAEEARRARHQRMAHAVDNHAPPAAEADLQLDLIAVRVLAHAAPRRDGLIAHREVAVAGVRRRELRVRVAVGGHGLPEGVALVRLNDGRAASRGFEWAHGACYPLLSILAHVSRSPTLRLNTRCEGDESRSSTQK